MSASLRTKDGSISIVAMMAAHEKSDVTITRIDLEGALAWGRQNGIKLGRPEHAIKRINASRLENKLPPFKIIQRRPRTAHVEGPVRAANNAAHTCPAPNSALPLLAGSEDELLDLVTKYTGTITCIVTPTIAKWLLALNTGNRPMQDDTTSRFRSVLREDRWINTGEPIIVSREGVLNDGQHRLTAIRDTNISAEVDVRFGIAREAFHATGTGKRRTVGNVLSIEGYSNAATQAAIARLLRHYDAGNMGQHRAQVEPSEIVKIVDGEDRIGQVAAKIARFKFGPVRGGAFGFVLVVAGRKNSMDKVFAFADLVASGATEDEENPARRLHVRLRDSALRREHLTQADIAILTVRAWNSWITDRSPQSLRVTEHDRTSAGFPKIQGEKAGGQSAQR